MYKWSLYNKIFILFSIILLLSVGGIGYFGLKSASDAYLQSAYELNERDNEALKKEIESRLHGIPDDLVYLSNFYALQRFFIWRSMGVESKTETWKQIFSDALLDFLTTQGKYYRARVLDLDGEEIISAIYDKESNRARIYRENLQNKSKKEYVQKSKTLQRKEFYVSEMALNKEHGEIERPFIPVVRYGTPIINKNGERIALLVMNFYADEILTMLQKELLKDKKGATEYYLISRDGEYLFHQDPSRRWGKQLKSGYNFNKEHFAISEFIGDKESGTFEYDDYVYSFAKVYPLKGDYENYWYMITSTKKSVALASLNSFKMIFLATLLAVFLLSFFLLRTAILKFTKPLTEVTKQLQALSRGEIDKREIEYKANDEIAAIVQSSTKLVDAIETTIWQADAVANGDFTHEFHLLGEHDALGLALIRMTQRLKEIASLAEKLSQGDYDVNVFVKDEQDRLGLALVAMVEYLKQVTEITEHIAKGRLDIEYEIKGEHDRLGRAVLEMLAYLKSILHQANAIAHEDFRVFIEAKSKDDELGLSLIAMTNMLQESSSKNKREIYFSEGVGAFSDAIAGKKDALEIAKVGIENICRYIQAARGVVYSFDKEKQELTLLASYAYVSRKNLANRFALGEGIVGQVALEKQQILLKSVHSEEYVIQSGTTEVVASEVFALPLLQEGELIGVIELLTLESFTQVQQEYLVKVASTLATALYTEYQNRQIQTLLERSQQAFEELQAQSEELQETNAQMEEQQEQLKLQSEELQRKNEILVEAKQEIDRRAKELEMASKYKSEFLANMSHELRTPLNSIILLSKFLMQNKTDEINDEDREKFAVIHKAGNDLLLLINDILDLSKIESGKMDLHYEKVTTSELSKDMKGLFGAVANEKKIEFVIEDNFQGAFESDKTKISQVLKNFLSNAFKFTKEGYVKLVFEKADAKHIKISVQDSGIGIPQDKLEMVFEAFKQVDGSISREYGGTGLGLSISKTIVDLMGGTITVESEVGKGSSFIVTLPIEHSEGFIEEKSESVPVVEQTKEPPITILLQDELEDEGYTEALDKKSILIVDDDSRNIFTLSAVLENMGAEVYSAFNGKEALELLEEKGDLIDIVLMDVMMPTMDGLEAIRSIRKKEQFGDIPIIAITAKSLPEDRDKCLEAGANDYLAKPIDGKKLLAMIKAWIGDNA